MKTEYYTCKKCKRRYEYNADIGYCRDNICGPFCDGILRGEEESAARISALEAERDRLKELLKEYMETCGTCDFIMMSCDLCAKTKASIGGEGK